MVQSSFVRGLGAGSLLLVEPGVEPVADHALARAEPVEFRGELVVPGDPADPEFAGADVEAGERPHVFALHETGQIVVAGGGEQRVVDDGSGRDDPGNLPLDDPFRKARVLHLLGDGDLDPAATSRGR